MRPSMRLVSAASRNTKMGKGTRWKPRRRSMPLLRGDLRQRHQNLPACGGRAASCFRLDVCWQEGHDSSASCRLASYRSQTMSA